MKPEPQAFFLGLTMLKFFEFLKIVYMIWDCITCNWMFLNTNIDVAICGVDLLQWSSYNLQLTMLIFNSNIFDRKGYAIF
jgi:hypothetical protein